MRADTANMEQLLMHAAWLRRVTKALIHDPDMADDVVQATLVSAWQRPPTGLIHDRAWLGKVAINQARDLLRGEKRRKFREQAVQVGAPTTVPGPDALLGEIAIHRTLAEVVSALAEPYRETILLRYYEDLDSTQIALRFGISSGTVRWRLKEGLAQVRRALDQRHHGDRKQWVIALLPTTKPLLTHPSNPVDTQPVLPRTISSPWAGWRLLGFAFSLVVVMSLLLGLLIKTLIPSSTASTPKSMGPVGPSRENTSIATSAAIKPPALRRLAPLPPDPQPAQMMALPSPETIIRHMLRAIETGSYEAFLDYADDFMKATLPRDNLDKLATTFGEKLEGGFALTSLGTVRREDHQEHLWKLELHKDGDDRLVRLSLALGYVHGFWID